MIHAPAHVKIEDLDRVIHERGRLAIVSALMPIDSASFAELKAAVGLTDGNLSVHLRILEDAGYVAIDKGYVGRKPRTDVRLVPRGRKAFQAYLAVLERIVRRGRR